MLEGSRKVGHFLLSIDVALNAIVTASHNESNNTVGETETTGL